MTRIQLLCRVLPAIAVMVATNASAAQRTVLLELFTATW
jgi:hypothetical protein